jgi:hypothetical protein
MGVGIEGFEEVGHEESAILSTLVHIYINSVVERAQLLHQVLGINGPLEYGGYKTRNEHAIERSSRIRKGQIHDNASS